MRPPVNQGLIPEGPNPFGYVTTFTVLHRQMSLYITRVFSPDMDLSRSMANFAPCIFQFRGLFEADKTAGLSISRGMTDIAPFQLFFRQPFSDSFKLSNDLLFFAYFTKLVYSFS